MINKLLYICFVYFIVSAIGDIILNFLSRQSYSSLKVRALKPYFLRNTIVKNNIVRDILSAFNAGITIVIALIVTMFVSSIIFKFNHPSSFYELFLFICIAFPIGYVFDYLIYKIELFGPSLRYFYKVVGAGFWGAMSFIAAIVISYVIINREELYEKYLKKYIK